MKKSNISVDFIAFGDLESETTKKLEAFHQNVNSGNGSHLEIIHPGPNLLSDSLITTPILGGDGMGVARGGADEGGDVGFDFGDAAAADPELAFALRLSLEEEKARLEKEQKEKEKKEGKVGLEGISEEVGESQPLLDQSGEPSGSGEGGALSDTEKNKRDDGDKMDTA